ncbi:MAG: thioredoxin domain-containing protein [Alphaproteobacteria bacterium]|nr:thioredoxin domain-containing protein [Alphaproteobacteria bacterium]
MSSKNIFPQDQITRSEMLQSSNRRDWLKYMGASMTFASFALMFPASSFATTNQSLVHISKPRFLGEPDAPIHIVEYFSMTCGHCGDFHNNTFPNVKSKMIDTGKVKFELSPFPLDGLALRAHALARALPENKYFGMITLLMNKQNEWMRADDPLKTLYRFGQLAGVSADDFNGLMQNRSLLEKIVEMRELGSTKWQINATPSFVVNNKKVISGNKTFDEFSAELAEFGI